MELLFTSAQLKGTIAIGAIFGRVCSFALLQTEKGVDRGREAYQTLPLSSYSSEASDKESDDAAGSRHRSPQATRQQTQREQHTADALAVQCG